MQTLGVILAFISVLFIIEGSIVAFNPKWTKAITKKLMKNTDTLRTIGVIEIIIGLIILALTTS